MQHNSNSDTYMVTLKADRGCIREEKRREEEMRGTHLQQERREEKCHEKRREEKRREEKMRGTHLQQESWQLRTETGVCRSSWPVPLVQLKERASRPGTGVANKCHTVKLS